MPFSKAITKYLGTVHAIAMCNLAGLMTDASIPEDGNGYQQG